MCEAPKHELWPLHACPSSSIHMLVHSLTVFKGTQPALQAMERERKQLRAEVWRAEQAQAC
eukprot:4029215-Pleurochrysis_carterae.AAC.7